LSEQGSAAQWKEEHTVPPFELDEATIDSLQEGLRSGKWTSRRLVEMYLERIDVVDKQGPALRNVLEINPDAQDLADRLGAGRKGGRIRGPVLGFPFFFKATAPTADGMPPPGGSLAWGGCFRARDGFLVQRLRAAGATLLGKTNPSEWAISGSSH